MWLNCDHVSLEFMPSLHSGVGAEREHSLGFLIVRECPPLLSPVCGGGSLWSAKAAQNRDFVVTHLWSLRISQLSLPHTWVTQDCTVVVILPPPKHRLMPLGLQGSLRKLLAVWGLRHTAEPLSFSLVEGTGGKHQPVYCIITRRCWDISLMMSGSIDTRPCTP